MSTDAPIQKVEVSSFVVPTDLPEADGTIAWKSTTMILVRVTAANEQGIGYTYASRASGEVVSECLAKELAGKNAFDIPAAWLAMVSAVRNLGRPGAAAMAISAVDIALWDLKAKLLGVPLATLLGRVRSEVEIYGSGGFTSYSLKHLQEQLGAWAGQGIRKVKMKIGSHPEDDLMRVAAARSAIGAECELFVDANGAYSRKQALQMADEFADYGVRWFEEPVSSDDLEGLRLIRDRAPAIMNIAAGEYGYDPVNLRRLLEAGAVDVLQIDVTRCLGMTGFMKAAAISGAHFIDISAHCAPSLHVALGCALPHFRHLEYFHDHVRIEQMFFDGVVKPVNGAWLRPDFSRAGLGLELKASDAQRFAA